MSAMCNNNFPCIITDAERKQVHRLKYCSYRDNSERDIKHTSRIETSVFHHTSFIINLNTEFLPGEKAKSWILSKCNSVRKQELASFQSTARNVFYPCCWTLPVPGVRSRGHLFEMQTFARASRLFGVYEAIHEQTESASYKRWCYRAWAQSKHNKVLTTKRQERGNESFTMLSCWD